jgi:hypothetical protein
VNTTHQIGFEFPSERTVEMSALGQATAPREPGLPWSLGSSSRSTRLGHVFFGLNSTTVARRRDGDKGPEKEQVWATRDGSHNPI